MALIYFGIAFVAFCIWILSKGLILLGDSLILKKANKLYKEGRFADAILEYSLAYSTDSDLRYLRKISKCLKELSVPEALYSNFEQYISEIDSQEKHFDNLLKQNYSESTIEDFFRDVVRSNQILKLLCEKMEDCRPAVISYEVYEHLRRPEQIIS